MARLPSASAPIKEEERERRRGREEERRRGGVRYGSVAQGICVECHRVISLATMGIITIMLVIKQPSY